MFVDRQMVFKMNNLVNLLCKTRGKSSDIFFTLQEKIKKNVKKTIKFIENR